MRPQALAAVLLCAFIGGCGQGSESSTISPDEVGHLAQAINYSAPDSIAAGGFGKFLKMITAYANKPYVATMTPQSGDATLYLLRQNTRGGWDQIAGSFNYGDMLNERIPILFPTTQDVWFYAPGDRLGYSFTLSVSWENSGQMDIDVPYLNQNTVPGGIGSSACGCTSVEMILAYWGKTKVDSASMKTGVSNCYMDPGMSYPSSSGIQSRLLDPMRRYNFKSVVVTSMGSVSSSTLYAKIQDEIRAGRPMVLSSYRFTSKGHFVVVTGFNSATGEIIVNDPYGKWKESVDSYDKSAPSKGIPYNFSKVIDGSTGNLVTIQ